MEAFKAEASRYPGIVSISATTDYPFEVNNTTSDPTCPGQNKDEVIPFKIITGDESLIPMLDIQLAEGRNFSGSKADTANYIVNEAAVKAMRLKDPVGTPFEVWFGKGKIIGVVKDFHNQNFRGDIEPLVILYYPANTWRLFVKVDRSKLEESLKNLETVYKKFDPVYPFRYSFLDQQFNQLYEHETTTGRLAICFTVVAVFISCLGLFGTPLAYYITDAFLSQYVFRAEIQYWVFAITACLIFIIAIGTVIFQSLKAAITNPVNSLRRE
jgi:hypothetical protein